MTLSRRMACRIVGITLALLLLCAASLWGLNGMRDGLRLAHEEYAELRMVQETGIHLAECRGLLQARVSDPRPIFDAITRAGQELDRFVSHQQSQTGVELEHQERELAAAASARSLMDGVADLLRSSEAVSEASAQRAVADVGSALTNLNTLARQMDHNVAQAQLAADRRLQGTLALIGGLSTAGVLLTTLLNVSQYRSVVAPLCRLREGVARLARGDLGSRVQLASPPEFRELADEFNQMAGELNALYGELEQKVVAKSRELVRSERLASVGFLAAGVAHEINNPLNIITGYAELLLRQAEKLPDARAAAELTNDLRIIREEGFRCKSIIEKLLSLARTSNKSRETVALVQVAQTVVGLVQGLKQFRDRSVRLALRPSDPLMVWGNESELKQVLLNLTVNALDATLPGSGEVVLEARRTGHSVELCVSDNGRGMTPQTLERVFEPFFTDRRPGGEHALGLGLSITYAIVESHGGRITAESGGPGQGSRFTVTLPAFVLAARDGQAA